MLKETEAERALIGALQEASRGEKSIALLMSELSMDMLESVGSERLAELMCRVG